MMILSRSIAILRNWKRNSFIIPIPVMVLNPDFHLIYCRIYRQVSMTIEENIGYDFKNKALLTRALTRKAYANELKQKNYESEDQEIFRTLGDAVLKAILIDLLIESGCNTRDEITGRKRKMEREEGLAEIGRDLGIGSSILLGTGEKKQKADEEPYVLAETFEALVAAIYLDGGFVVTKDIIGHLFKDYLKKT